MVPPERVPSWHSLIISNNMKLHRTLVLAVAAVLLTACANDEAQIRQCAQGYLDAMGNYRPTEARQYATQQTCDVTLAFFEKVMEFTDSSVYANNIPAEITIGDITIANDTTATACFHKSTPSVQQDGTIDLVKRDGKWQVNAVLNVPQLPSKDQGPRTLSDEEIKALREKYGKKR